MMAGDLKKKSCDLATTAKEAKKSEAAEEGGGRFRDGVNGEFRNICVVAGTIMIEIESDDEIVYTGHIDHRIDARGESDRSSSTQSVKEVEEFGRDNVEGRTSSCCNGNLSSRGDINGGGAKGAHHHPSQLRRKSFQRIQRY